MKYAAAASYLLIVVALCGSSTAQTTIGGELRLRPELRRGYRTVPDSNSTAAFFVDQRARVNLHFKSEKFQVYGSLQEARTWGEEEQLKDVATLGVHEFWGQVQFCKTLLLKAGRQELKYDDERLLGSSDWLAQARSHDAAVLKFASAKGWKADLGGAFNQAEQNNFGTYYPLNTYKTLEFLWAGKSWHDSIQELKLSAIAIGDGTQTSDTTGVYTRFTIGFNLDYERQTWILHLAAYDQAGKDPQQKSISAYMINLYGSYLVSTRWVFTLGLDYLSGTDQTDDGNASKQNTFSTLYSSNHPFYGIADYFLNIPSDTKNGGLIAGYAKGSCSISKIKITSAMYYFALESEVAIPSNPEQPLDKSLGAEFDAWGSYSFTNEVNVFLGGSLIFGTSSMDSIKGVTEGQTGAWIYTGVCFKPTFFSSAN